MQVSYDNLWKMLIDRKMNKTDLRTKAGIGTSTLARLSKGKQVSMSAIMKICTALNCDIVDVMEITSKDDKTEIF